MESYIITIPAITFIFLSILLEYLRPRYPKYFEQVIDKYRLQTKEYNNAVKLSFLNLGILVFLVYFTYPYYPQSINLTFWSEVGKLLMMLVLGDTMFYWSHRFLHIPQIYKYAHKLHHQHKSPITWTAFNFHPLELAIIVVFYSPLIMFVPLAPQTLTAFLTIVVVSLVKSHCGIDIKTKDGQEIFSSKHHDLHHLKFNYNYGTDFGTWDILMGTKIWL